MKIAFGFEGSPDEIKANLLALYLANHSLPDAVATVRDKALAAKNAPAAQ